MRLYVSGTVQDMYYRPFVKESADKLGIKGFIRNLEDGRVEIFIEGNPEEVRTMIELCKKGPRHASIRNVETKPERFQDMKTFKVLHI